MTSTTAMSESELQSNVRNTARLGGWFVYHTHDARRSDKGFPDLTLVHPITGRLIFAELKSSKGRVRAEQTVWLQMLGIRHEAVIWRPEDWHSGAIQALLLSERSVAA